MINYVKTKIMIDWVLFLQLISEKKVSANPAKAKWVFNLGILIYVVVFWDTWEIYDFILIGIWTHLGMSSQLLFVVLALVHVIWEFAWKQVWFHSASLIHKTIVLSIKIIVSLHYWALFPGVEDVFPRSSAWKGGGIFRIMKLFGRDLKDPIYEV